MLSKGNVIIRSKPFAYCIDYEQRGILCDWCFESNELLKCSKCKAVKYCNKSCQGKAWFYHKFECPFLLEHVPKNNVVRLIGQIILILKNRRANLESERILNVPKRKFQDLMSHADELREIPQKYDEFLEITEQLENYLPPDFIQRDKLWDYYGQVLTNGFTISDYEGNTQGFGLYLGPSALDHSCRPNACYYFDGPELTIRALEDIPDENVSKVFISYVDIFQTTKIRKEKLREKYLFDCECPYCMNESREKCMNAMKCGNEGCDRIYEDDQNDICKACTQPCKIPADVFYESLSNVSTQVTQLAAEKKHAEILDTSEKFMANFSNVVHIYNITTLRMFGSVMKAAIRLENLNLAEKYGNMNLIGYRFYSDTADATINLMLKVGQIRTEINKDLNEGLDYLRDAILVLRVTRGEGHSLVRVVKEAEKKCIRKIVSRDMAEKVCVELRQQLRGMGQRISPETREQLVEVMSQHGDWYYDASMTRLGVDVAASVVEKARDHGVETVALARTLLADLYASENLQLPTSEVEVLNHIYYLVNVIDDVEIGS